jgi:integrase/recombinase XerD
MTTAPATGQRRTPPKRKARQLAKHLRDERPDYAYLKAVFRALRDELDVQVKHEPKTLPYVPSEDEIRRYYQTVWQARRSGDMVLIKTPALHRCPRRRARRHSHRRRRPRRVPDSDHPRQGRQRSGGAVPAHLPRDPGAAHRRPAQDRRRLLFESSWKKPYSTRGVRALLARYASVAGLPHNMSPHELRHFLFTWLKTQGIDDALIQPYSGHASRQSLEIHSRLAPHRRPSQLRPGHRPIPRLKISPVCGWRHVQEFRAVPVRGAACQS